MKFLSTLLCTIMSYILGEVDSLSSYMTFCESELREFIKSYSISLLMKWIKYVRVKSSHAHSVFGSSGINEICYLLIEASPIENQQIYELY